MEIEIGPEEYEVLPPEEPGPLKNLWNKLLDFSSLYGGWKSIIALCVFFYFFGFLILPENTDKFIALWGSNYDKIIKINHSYYRFITANFLHFGFIHLAMNMFGAFMLGRFLQNFWDKRSILVLFLISGIGANILSYFIMKAASAGASGGVFGLMGAILSFLLWGKRINTEARKQLLSQMWGILGINLFIGIAIPNIDWVGHIGGFIVGMLLSVVIEKLSLNNKNFWLALWVVCILAILVAFILATKDLILITSNLSSY